MSSEETSFVEEASKNMLTELQSWWEIPALAQYISLFREPFNLPELEIEELEDGFIDDTVKGPSEWLNNLIILFLKSIMPGRVNNQNWEEHLRKLVRRKWLDGPYSEKENPFIEDKPFHQLPLRSKVEVIYSFCFYRLDRNDTAELMKSMDAIALRVQKLGSDADGNNYWYFYGTRLYKEESKEEKKTWDEEWKEQKKKSFRKKRGRGRPPRQSLEKKALESENAQSSPEFMNANEESRWSVACDTIEEWVNFAEKFKKSKHAEEKKLFNIITENFLPTLNQIYEEKEKKLQQKIKELMSQPQSLPRREKIVTRRETRKMRGENVDVSYISGYASDEGFRTHVKKDRARRLEERNKRASEADAIQIIPTHKRARHSRPDEDSDVDSSFFQASDSKETDLQSLMERLLSSVKLHKDAWPFLYPVSEEDAPGYYEIIKDPVDLSKIESRLYRGKYETVGDLDADFSKMVSNCELYNGEYHAYSKMAQTLRKTFRKQVAKILDSLELKSEHGDSEEGSSDSQYHSSSNSTSPPHESPVVSPKEHKKSKSGKKKQTMEALEVLAKASNDAVQDNVMNRASPQKKSPAPQQIQPAPYHVPSSLNMPYNSVSSSSSSENKTSLPVTSSSFAPVNTVVKGPQRIRQLIIKTKTPETEKRTSPVQSAATTSFNTVSNVNSNNTVQQNNMYQSVSPKTVPKLVISGLSHSSTNSSELRVKSSPASAVTMQSCMPNGMPVLQQVLIPAGSQQIQIPGNGQILFASPQNAVRFFSKDQNVQLQNNLGHLNQNFGKTMPQIVAPTSIMQVTKDGLQNVQFQTLSPDNAQAFTQVTQSPQFVNIPYMLSNQSAMNNSPQSVMNLQPYQLPPRQIHISGQGTG